MHLAFVACVPVILSVLLLNFGCVRAEYYSRSFDNVNSNKKDSMSDEDLLNFLEDIYANEEIKSFPDQDEYLQNDRGGKKTPKPSILDYIRYVPDSEQKQGWNDDDFYDLLDFLNNANTNDLYDYGPWIGSEEASRLDNEDAQTLLAGGLLGDILDNTKAEESLKSNDVDIEDFFEEEMKKQSEKEEDEKSESKAEEAPSEQSENEEAGALKTSDGKKERGQKEVDTKKDTESTQSEGEAASTINEKDDEKDKKDFAVDQNDVDELRSLLTQLADSEKAENSLAADTEDKSDKKIEDDSGSNSNTTDVKIKLEFPGITITEDDTYLCTSVKLSDYTNSSDKAMNIVEYIPHAKQTVAHHMLLYGCEYTAMKKPGAVWNCGGWMENDKKVTNGYPTGMICGILGKTTILWAWAKNAPAFELPKDVAFKIGDGTLVHYLILQVHYKTAESFIGGRKDYSGVTVVTSPKPRPRLAGVYILGSVSGTVPPHSSANFDIACKYKRPFSVHPFAFRTHTHALGVEVLGYRIRDGVWTLIGAKNPQLPEAFYPTPLKNMTIRYDDWLAARCKMKSNRNYPTEIGFRHTDEMCNFYFMFWVDAKYEKQMDKWDKSCFYGYPRMHWSSLPGYRT